MSLIMALETYEGIVMTADRLSVVSFHNEEYDTNDCFHKSFNAHKLFLTINGYGISFCGDSKISNNYLIEQYIQEIICTKDYYGIAPNDIAQDILKLLKQYDNKTTLLLCGYFKDQSFAIEINCARNEVFQYPDAAKFKVLRFGDIDITNSILDNKFYYGYNTYRLQDAIDLLVYTNQVTAKYQQFQEVLQTVSEECDVLILFKSGTYQWLNRNELHI